MIKLPDLLRLEGICFLSHWLLMGRSRTCPNLRSPMGKSRKYANSRHLSLYTIHQVPKCLVINRGSGTAINMQKSDLTSCHSRWPGDLALNGRGHREHTTRKIDGWMVKQNFAALRAAAFPLFMENLKGGGYPPVGARVNPPLAEGGGEKRPHSKLSQ